MKRPLIALAAVTAAAALVGSVSSAGQPAKHYGANTASWHKPSLCGRDLVDCDSNNAITARAIATPPRPLENRGTFHQAVEIFP